MLKKRTNNKKEGKKAWTQEVKMTMKNEKILMDDERETEFNIVSPQLWREFKKRILFLSILIFIH